MGKGRDYASGRPLPGTLGPPKSLKHCNYFSRGSIYFATHGMAAWFIADQSKQVWNESNCFHDKSHMRNLINMYNNIIKH